MDLSFIILVLELLAEILNRRETKPEPQKSGDINVIIINGGINHK